MKIAKYIGDLIYDYECVVIPGLGGFISTHKSAQINKITHQFKPPVKDIHFNIHLKANDGLLINYVARNEGISYKHAKQSVDKFVLLCNNALKNGKRINFSKIGYIFLDANENIVFHQDNSINYNPESFGLTSFISPAIRRPSDEQKIKEVFTKTHQETPAEKDKKNTKKDRRIPAEANSAEKLVARSKPSKVKQQLGFVFAILFLMGSYYVYNRRDAMLYYWNNNKHMVPFMYTQPHEFLSANAGILHLEKVNVQTAGWLSGLFNSSERSKSKIDKKDPIITAKPEVESDLVPDKPEDTREVSTDIKPVEITENEINSSSTDNNNDDQLIEEPKEKKPSNNEVVSSEAEVADKPIYTDNKYFIIAGSFGNISNAKRLVQNLKIKGYDAIIADTNARGLFRVAYMGFSNMTEAERQLIAIRRETNSQAWILVK